MLYTNIFGKGLLKFCYPGALGKATTGFARNSFQATLYGPDMFDKIDADHYFSMAPNVWYHVVMAYDGDALRLYLDGELVESIPRIGSIHSNSTPTVIGALSDNFHMMDGVLDDVCVWDRSLTSQEINAVFNATSCGGG